MTRIITDAEATEIASNPGAHLSTQVIERFLATRAALRDALGPMMRHWRHSYCDSECGGPDDALRADALLARLADTPEGP